VLKLLEEVPAEGIGTGSNAQGHETRYQA
jgi:hypothetical protein